MMRAALYARVSTVGNGQSPEMQIRELREYAERRGWIVAGEHVDLGISGAKEKRPELDRLIADAYRWRFDAVVVWKFDRFARSVSHLLRGLENFKALGIEFVSLSEHWIQARRWGRWCSRVWAPWPSWSGVSSPSGCAPGCAVPALGEQSWGGRARIWTRRGFRQFERKG